MKWHTSLVLADQYVSKVIERVALPLAGVPRTRRVPESVEDVQHHNNTRTKYLFIFSYNAETVSLRKDVFADTDASKEKVWIAAT